MSTGVRLSAKEPRESRHRALELYSFELLWGVRSAVRKES